MRSWTTRGNAEIVRLPQDADREERRHEIANAGHEPEDRIEADAVRRARHLEGGIEEPRGLTQRMQTLLLPGRELTQSGYATLAWIDDYRLSIRSILAILHGCRRRSLVVSAPDSLAVPT